MDYDDNDFQSQNLHIAGEGSNKFPPVLRPYALPRFEFDDSLHGHLRFDSLVETEVFLGIESNEDNQWIEDFTRGSSGIAFSTSAAESCSISRRNNVWSEATSSESVEMLLKSVGQDEIVPGQTITKESDACDELGCIIKQMEPSSKHEDSSLSKIEDVISFQPTVQPDDIPGKISGLKDDVQGEGHLVEDASRTHEGQSVDKGLNDTSAISKNAALAVTDGGESVQGDDNAVGQTEVVCSIDESLDNRRQEDNFVSLPVVTRVPSVQNTSSVMLDNQDVKHLKNDTCDGNSDSLEKHIGRREECCLSQDIHFNDDSLAKDAVSSGIRHVEDHSVSDVPVKEVGNLDENNVANVGEPSALVVEGEPSAVVVEGDSDFHMVEGCNEVILSSIPCGDGKSEDVLSKDSEVSDMSERNLHSASSISVVGATTLKEHAGEDRNTNIERCDNEELKMDSIKITCDQAAEKKDSLESHCQLDTKILVSNSNESLRPVEDDKFSQGGGSSNSDKGDISSLNVVCSSAELPMRHTSESLEDLHDTSGVCGAEPTKVCEENIVSRHSDVYKRDRNTFVCAKQSIELSSDCSNMDSGDGGSLDVDKRVGSSSFPGVCTANEIISTTHTNPVPSNDSGCPGHAVIDQKEVQVSPMPVVGTSVDKEDSDLTAPSSEASFSNLKTAAVTTDLCPVPGESGEQLSCEMVDKHVSMADTSIEDKQSKCQAGLLPKVAQECSNELEISPVFCSSTAIGSASAEEHVISKSNKGVEAKENLFLASSEVADAEPKNEQICKNPVPSSSNQTCHNAGQNGEEDTETASISGDKNIGEAATQGSDGDAFKTHDTSLSTGPSESQTKFHAVETGCSSPIVIRNSEPSQSEAENGGVKGFTDHCVSASEVVDGVSQDPKGSDASTSDRSFTFEVPPLSELSQKEAGKNWQPFPTMQHAKTIAEGSPSTSGLSQVDTKTAQDAPHAVRQASDKEKTPTRSGSKGSSERKTRRSSSKSTGREPAKKGNPAKETTPARQSGRGDRTSNVSLSSSGISQLLQSNEMQQHGHIENSTIKQFGVLSTPVSSLPDLNTSASLSAVFQQPFTDMQQVQLRAQIFVYGALIQGTAPDEAYMISAFGGPDGGKSMWENAWRASIERVHGQKSHPINPETQMQPRLGKPSDQPVKQSMNQSKATSTPASRATSKGTTTPIVNSMIPLSSPLWSIPTPDAIQSTGIPRGAVMDYQQALSPLHPHQTPPIRNFVGPTASWVSHSPFRAPWVPQTSSFDTVARFPVLPITETVNLTPVREASLPHSSRMKQVSPAPVVQSGSSANVFAGTPLLDTKKITVTPGQHSSDPKPRKRKKIPVSDEPGQIVLHSQSQTEPYGTPVVTSNVPTSVATEKFIMSVSPTVSSEHLRKVGRDADQRTTLSEETHGNLKQAQMQAEDAAALAAAALTRSQEIWNQLDKQKNSGLAPDVETKLTSAAVAIAAAAAVAKAAAAAANVAANAALQAKMMADEALILSDGRNSVNANANSSDSGKNLGQATPASILRGDEVTNSSNPVIVAAREAARRRLEAASAASKRAENMDAIVKAAELAAEAVSQAGKIVAMGDPLPLSQLVDAGPEGYWRVQVNSELVMQSNDLNRESRGGIGEGPDTSARHSKDVQLDKKEPQSANHGSSATTAKEKKGPKGRKAAGLTKTIEVVPEAENGLTSSSKSALTEHEKAAETLKGNIIREGSHVEVLRDGGGSNVAWFLADVLSLKDGKAFVCYNELRSEDDGDKLKEWVVLNVEGDKAPRIRIARPITAVPFEGTRKRRRAAMGDYNWSVGDRVDAWMQDSWWEGVVSEKTKKDETSLTVHFPVRGEKSFVKAWHLRPSLIWKDSEWIEWSSSGDNSHTSREGDTPQEKRQKVSNLAVEVKGKDKVLKSSDIMELEKPDDTRLLDLSVSEKIFNIGKNTRDENKTDSLRMARTGLQKEGSRVVFGVPKPGKKRKFMEVSKHYVADQASKNPETNEQVKFTKYLMPQGSGPRGAKSNFKSEPKEKRMAVSKPKVLKSGKPQSISGRSIPQKDNSSQAAVSEHDGAVATDVSKMKDSLTHGENTSGKSNTMEFRPFSSSEGVAEGPILFSSVALPSDAPASKKTSTSNVKSDRTVRGKLAPAAGKMPKIEEDKVLNGNSTKATSEVVEPRRSNRRIQPTSRLLEGLQSSLIISKIPSVSHDKGHKSQRSTRGGNLG